MGRHGTIAGRKSAQDARRAAMFTKYTRQIIVAAKEGGDPDFNSSLRVAIDKAKAIGMPTIRKTINAMKTISMTRITSISSSSVDYSFAICF